MQIDPENPVVKLCGRGIEAELRGEGVAARALFREAWATHRDDYEACIAAHYLARYEVDPVEALRWNRLALERAEAVGDARVHGFLASLHLNVGRSYEDLGDRAAARNHYERAGSALADVEAGPYRDVLAGGIAAALARVRDD